MALNNGTWMEHKDEVLAKVANIDTNGEIESGDHVVESLTSSGLVNQQEALTTGPGAGVTGGTGTICVSSIQRHGNIINTQILVDITGLKDSSTAGDIIGHDAATDLPAYLGRLTDECGAVWGGRMTCLEVPAGGDLDIMVYSSDKAVGVYDLGIGEASMGTETQIFDSAGDWAAMTQKNSITVPAEDDYLYLVSAGNEGSAAAYTGGRFLIELWGYAA